MIPRTVAARLFCPWNSPGKNTREGSHFLLQGIFPTQASNQDLLHCRQILYCLSHQGSIVGTDSGQKIQRDQKEGGKSHFWRSWSKRRGSGGKKKPHKNTKNQGSEHVPCTQYHIRGGQPPEPPLPSDPWTDPLLCIRNQLITTHPAPHPSTSHHQQASKGSCCLFLLPSCCRRGHGKALPEFLVWPLVNFYWLGKAKNPGQ